MNPIGRIALTCSLALPFLVVTPSPAQVLIHGPVVGGVTDTAAQVFLRTDRATAIAVRWGADPNYKAMKSQRHRQ